MYICCRSVFVFFAFHFSSSESYFATVMALFVYSSFAIQTGRESHTSHLPKS